MVVECSPALPTNGDGSNMLRLEQQHVQHAGLSPYFGQTPALHEFESIYRQAKSDLRLFES